MITKEQLQAMSDFEVNKSLASLVMSILKKETWTFNDNKNTVQFFNEVTKKSRAVDYCNTPNDIMPLAFELGISIIKDHDAEQYYACNAFDDRNYDFAYRQHEYHDANPYRAIACCLILVLQEKK